MDDCDLESKRFQESLSENTSQFNDQAEVEELLKQLQVMKVEIDIQRAQAIQLIQVVDGKQYEKLEKYLIAFSTHANHWDWRDYENYSIFKVKRGNIKNCLSTIYYPIPYNFDIDPNCEEKMYLGQLIRKMSLLPRRKEEHWRILKSLWTLNSKRFITFELLNFINFFVFFQLSLSVDISLNIENINLSFLLNF